MADRENFKNIGTNLQFLNKFGKEFAVFENFHGWICKIQKSD